MSMHSIISTVLFFSLIWLSSSVIAQDLSPRAYWPSPTGTKVATVGYSYVTGDAVPDRSLPLTGVDSTINNVHFGYRQTFNLWDRTANITLDLPFTKGETVGILDSGLDLSRDYDGVGDVGATLAINFLGAPAMNREQFGALTQNPHALLGGSIRVVAPTGTYNPKRLINVGANRWAAKAELGYIAPISPKWLLEVSLGAWFFEDNDEFLGVTKEQKPVVTVQGHLIHRFSRGFWVSLDANYYEGGRSTIGGNRLDDLQRDSKLGATVVYPVSKGKAVKLGYSKGSLNDSDESFNVFQISYQQVF
jgi:hypothetical protein